MFTGIIEEIGKISALRSFGEAKRIAVQANLILSDLKIDDSVSINGVCQTVVSIKGNIFEVEAVEETMRKTTLASFTPGKKVNLERALSLTTRLGGHIVQGHADCKGKVQSVTKENAGILLWISFDQKFQKYLVNTGSVTVDGVSLTSARVENGRFLVSIIPHTWKNTSLCELSMSSEVNLEFDIIGKYVENLMSSIKSENTNSSLQSYIDQPY